MNPVRARNYHLSTRVSIQDLSIYFTCECDNITIGITKLHSTVSPRVGFWHGYKFHTYFVNSIIFFIHIIYSKLYYYIA